MTKNSSNNIDNNKKTSKYNAPPDNATNDNINSNKYGFDYIY